jgi:threonine dehydrogenase-like Zn-dependent dehydrogenase
MRAAVFKERGLIQVEEVPRPRPGPGQALLRVRFCGICGSDLRAYEAGRAQAGAVMGHEMSGVIAELAPGVEGWKVGDRVTPSPFKPCQTCASCLSGMQNLCRNTSVLGEGPPGGFAEYVVVDSAQMFPTPEGVTDEEGATAEPLGVGLRGVRLSGMRVGDSVLVTGAGPIGLMALQCAKAGGASQAFVAEPSPVRAAIAEKLGGDVVLDPRSADVRREVRKATRVGANVVFECSGTAAGARTAISCVRAGGLVMILGIGESLDFSFGELARREIGVKGVMGYWEEFPMGIELMRQKRVRNLELISEAVPLDEVQNAFQQLLRERSKLKVLVAQ